MTFAAIYDALNSDINYPYLLKPITKLIDKEAHILEIGCGTGFVLEVLEQQQFKHLTGLDYDQDMLKIAKSRVKYANLMHHDIKDPVKEQYDVILAIFDVINYFDKLKQLFINLKQALRPQGILIFDVYKEEYLTVMNGYQETLSEPFEYTWEITTNNHTLNHAVTAFGQTHHITQYIQPLTVYTDLLDTLGFSWENIKGHDERKYVIKAHLK